MMEGGNERTEKEDLIDKAKRIVMSVFDNAPIRMYEEPTPEIIKNVIIEIDGRYVGNGSEKHSIIINHNNKEEMFIMVDESTYSRSLKENKTIQPEEKLSVIAVRVANLPIYITVSVIRLEEKNIFSSINSLYNKAKYIKEFYRLEVYKQEAILKQLKGKQCDKYGK